MASDLDDRIENNLGASSKVRRSTDKSSRARDDDDMFMAPSASEVRSRSKKSSTGRSSGKSRTNDTDDENGRRSRSQGKRDVKSKSKSKSTRYDDSPSQNTIHGESEEDVMNLTETLQKGRSLKGKSVPSPDKDRDVVTVPVQGTASSTSMKAIHDSAKDSLVDVADLLRTLVDNKNLSDVASSFRAQRLLMDEIKELLRETLTISKRILDKIPVATDDEHAHEYAHDNI